MSKPFESSSFDYDELKRDIVEAIRVTIRELAAEDGVTYEDKYDELFGGTSRRRLSKSKAGTRENIRRRRGTRRSRRVSRR